MIKVEEGEGGRWLVTIADYRSQLGKNSFKEIAASWVFKKMNPISAMIQKVRETYTGDDWTEEPTGEITFLVGHTD